MDIILGVHKYGLHNSWRKVLATPTDVVRALFSDTIVMEQIVFKWLTTDEEHSCFWRIFAAVCSDTYHWFKILFSVYNEKCEKRLLNQW